MAGVVAALPEAAPEVFEFPKGLLVLAFLRLKRRDFRTEIFLLLLQVPDPGDDHIVVGLARHLGLHIETGQGLVLDFGYLQPDCLLRDLVRGSGENRALLEKRFMSLFLGLDTGLDLLQGFLRVRKRRLVPDNSLNL